MGEQNDCFPLPEDVVVDILLRLPVKSLLRFKYVCKNWHALIKSPNFIEKHFHHKNNHARLLVCNMEVSFPLIDSVVFYLLPEKIIPGVTPEQKTLLHLPGVDHFTSVVGPVDGLFLLQEHFYGDGVRLGLWNPATREFRPLLLAPFETEHLYCNYQHEFGLGFDMLTQDYKVIWIRVFWEEQSVYPHVYVCVYSSFDNSWKDLEFPSNFTSGLPCEIIYLNGVYYWESMCVNKMYKIHSFDTINEQFEEIQGPDIPSEHDWRLILYGDSIAMLFSDFDNAITSIYEMKQEGSWSKVLTVQLHIDAHWPRNIWENGKIVFQSTETSQLVLYDPKTSQFTNLGIKDRCLVFNYKESLALIKRGNETQEQDNVVEKIEDFFNIIPTDPKFLLTVRGPPPG